MYSSLIGYAVQEARAADRLVFGVWCLVFLYTTFPTLLCVPPRDFAVESEIIVHWYEPRSFVSLYFFVGDG